MYQAIYKCRLCGEKFSDGKINENIAILFYLAFFVPIMNIIIVILLFMMLSVKKSDFDKMCEEEKKNREEQ